MLLGRVPCLLLSLIEIVCFFASYLRFFHFSYLAFSILFGFCSFYIIFFSIALFFFIVFFHVVSFVLFWLSNFTTVADKFEKDRSENTFALQCKTLFVNYDLFLFFDFQTMCR